MIDYNNKTIFYFQCDERGRNTKKDGFKNSNGGLERPFIVLSDLNWNKKNNNDGIYAIPITGSGNGTTFSYTIGDDTFEDSTIGISLIGSIVLCDKICRVSHTDRHTIQTPGLKLSYSAYNRVKKNIQEFIRASF